MTGDPPPGPPASPAPGRGARAGRTGADRPALGAAYDTAWARRWPARLLRRALLDGVGRPGLWLLARPERRGLDRLADLRGPAIFAANHVSHLDTGLLLSSLPAPWRHRSFVGAAADYFFDTRAKAITTALTINAIPIERTKVTRRSAQLAVELIGAGWSMVIFPEGGRSPDGWVQPFRAGAAFLAVRAGVPVVPVHLAGTGRILPKGARRVVPGRTRVTFGPPLRQRDGEDMRSLSRRIEAAVAALADEAATDWWSARRRAHAGRTPPGTGPDAPPWRRAWALRAGSPEPEPAPDAGPDRTAP